MIDGTGGEGSVIRAEGEGRNSVLVVLELLRGARQLGSIVDEDGRVGSGGGDEVPAVGAPSD